MGNGHTRDGSHCQDSHIPRGGGVPKSRPMVGASKGLTTSLGKLLSDLIEPVSRMNNDSREAQSTEEVMRMIEEVNFKRVEDGVKEIALGSMDMVAL